VTIYNVRDVFSDTVYIVAYSVYARFRYSLHNKITVINFLITNVRAIAKYLRNKPTT